MNAETIAAIATPPGLGGVGIVRVSGPRASLLVQAIGGQQPAPRHATLATFRDARGESIDTGLVLWFPGPASYTGEDLVEFQGHGGPVVLELLLERCLELGARLARPGEFTERAFLHGKLDLVQAEAVADLIESGTRLAARLAGRSLQGVFSQRIQALRDGLIRLRMLIEATLDFPEEALEPTTAAALVADLHDLIAQTRTTLDQAHQGQRLRDGLALVIAGPPNAGKSSLLNRLSNTDAAIVTPYPGTTRDALKVDIAIDGLPVRLVDTAGLRQGADPIEQEGIRRAGAEIRAADLLLWVEDASLESPTSAPDWRVLAGAPPDLPGIRVLNKIDLVAQPPRITATATGHCIALSALTGAGLDLLRQAIKAQAGLGNNAESGFVARQRHVDALRRALAHLDTAAALTDSPEALAEQPELIAEDLAQAQRALDEITGVFTSDDLLGRIFASFCIGK